jgi:alpha-1,2-mannosyltransferase
LAVLALSPWGVRDSYLLLDLSVYRGAAAHVLGSTDLYGRTYGVHPLPFTYPPVAAIVMLPLRALRLGETGALWTAASLGFLLLLVWAGCAAGSSDRLDRRTLWAVSLVVFAGALWLEPVQSTLGLGQVNLILDGMIVIDLSGLVRRVPSGTLVGLTAAVKLVPLFFVVYLLVIRRSRDAITATLVFLGATLAGWLVAPAASEQYWRRIVFETDRVGSPQYVANQSLHGVIVRLLGVEHSAVGTALWLGSSLAVGVWGLSLAARMYAAYGPLPGVLAAACASLLVAPVSWSHYYVWIAPVAALMLTAGQVLPVACRVGGLACVLVFLAAPIWWPPHGHDAELHYTAAEQLLGSSYVLATLGLLALAEMLARRTSTRGIEAGTSIPALDSPQPRR